ncbi:hypothetical protein DFH28DRAFT_897114 [Melampsora americana]|nr:hypothetical protein DFH28DRAFT_897114 [Melampsora americana]
MAKGLAACTSRENTEAELYRKFPGQLPFRLGPMTNPCVHCGALRFSEERSKDNIRLARDLYLNCCQYGAVTLPLKFMPGGPLPDELLDLYTGSHDREFPHQHTRLLKADTLLSGQGLPKKHHNLQ